MACCRCGACGNAYQHGDNGCDCVVIFVCRGSFVFLLLLLMTYFTYFLPLLASPVGGQSVMDTSWVLVSDFVMCETNGNQLFRCVESCVTVYLPSGAAFQHRSPRVQESSKSCSLPISFCCSRPSLAGSSEARKKRCVCLGWRATWTSAR